jgi:hypothetical protein
MNPRPFLACIAIVAGTALAPAAPAAPNQLTAAEKSAGWTLLFDGKTTTGWRVYNKKGAAINGWTVVDGTLHCQSKVKGDNIITEKQFNDFELAWEWKLLPTGNNGVKYFVTEARPKSPGPEYQMIDDVGHPDGKLGPDRQTASFYEVLPPAADKPLRKPGEWNESKIVVRGKKVEHWLNGRNVLSFEMGSDAVKAGILDSKFKNEPGFGDKIVGHIMLTYHQDDCWYRNIKIREIK